MRITMIRQTALTATLAAVLAAPGVAQAVDYTAADFFAGCPFIKEFGGPVRITGGPVEVVGDCTIDLDDDVAIEFDGVTVSTTGFLHLIGLGSGLVVESSTITAGTSLSLDVRGNATVTLSTLTAQTGSINLPPQNDLVINESALSAATAITLGGSGGTRNVTDSTLTAGEDIIIAQGGSGTPFTLVQFAILDAGRRISIGGNAYHSIADSTFLAGGAGPDVGEPNTIVLGPAPTFDSGAGAYPPSEVLRSTFTAPNGTFEIGGVGAFTVEDVEVFAGGVGVSTDHHDAVADLGPTSMNALRLTVSAPEGVVHMGGGGNWTCERCQVVAGGGSGTGVGLYMAPGSDFTLIDSKARSRAGGITFGGGGHASIATSRMQSDVAADNGEALIVGPSGARNIASSQLKTKSGRLTITGSGLGSIIDSKLLGKDDAGVYVSGAMDMAVYTSKITSKKGAVRLSNGGDVTASDSKIKSGGGLGFIVQSGLLGGYDVDVSGSKIKAPEALMESDDVTTVQENKFKVDGAVVIKGTTMCTSTDNKPDTSCM